MDCLRSSVRDLMQICLCFWRLARFCSACAGVRWERHGVPGTRELLTSCLWVLSCWWMPFAEPELPMACKSHEQMLNEVHQTTVPRLSTRWRCLLDRVLSGSKLVRALRNAGPRTRRPKLSELGCISLLGLRPSWQSHVPSGRGSQSTCLCLPLDQGSQD